MKIGIVQSWQFGITKESSMRKSSIVLTTAALVIMLAGPGSQPARADVKSDFQKGCESGNGSFVQNAGGVQCNTTGGTTIACDNDIKHCTASAQVIHTTRIPETAGAVEKYLTGKAKIAAPHGWAIVKTQRSK